MNEPPIQIETRGRDNRPRLPQVDWMELLSTWGPLHYILITMFVMLAFVVLPMTLWVYFKTKPKQTVARRTVPAKAQQSTPPVYIPVERAPTQTEIDLSFLNDTYAAFSGVMLHREPHPRSVTIGGREWVRTNGFASLDSRPYVVYESDDPSRRLIMFFQESSAEMFPLWFDLQEQRVFAGSRWVADGHTVQYFGRHKPSIICYSTSNGGTMTRLTPHQIAPDGSLLAENPVVVSEPWK